MAHLREKLRSLTHTMWAMVAFLIGFAVLLVFVARQYFLPAVDAASNADPGGRQQLAAVSALLLVILLAMIVVGLLLAFRVRRFFFPTSKPTPTQYTDAWREAGRRIN